MNIRAWIDVLKEEYYGWGGVNAVPWDLLRYKDVYEQVSGMTTPSNMHFINLAVQRMTPNECYLEVGAWRGRSIIGALLGNTAEGISIDNDVMDDHDNDQRRSQDVWRENVAKFGMTGRATYIDGAVPEVWSTLNLKKPAGVYLFDGDKNDPEVAYEGLIGVLPFLANHALIFVDDANDINIRMAVHKFCTNKDLCDHLIHIVDIPTPGNCWPMFWNGITAIAWRR